MPKAKKLNPTITVALITFAGTIISAAFASPLIIKLFEKPAAAQELQLQTGEGTTETAQIALIGDKHLVTHKDLLRLDRNDYYIDEALEIAVKRISGDKWEVGTFDKLPAISTTDVPMMGLGIGMLGNMYYKQTELAVFGIRHREGHEVLLGEDSKISSVPMNLNLYNNTEYLRASLDAQVDMMSRTNPDQVALFELLLEDDDMLRQVQSTLSSSFEEYLDTQLPVEKRVHSGVYVIPIHKENMESSLFQEVLPESTLLDRTLNYMSFSGLYNFGSLQNLIVDQEDGIASFKASAELENVKIDGKSTNATLNNIGFIVAGEERALLVILIYFDVDGLAELESLQVSLDSLRFTR